MKALTNRYLLRVYVILISIFYNNYVVIIDITSVHNKD